MPPVGWSPIGWDGNWHPPLLLGVPAATVLVSGDERKSR